MMKRKIRLLQQIMALAFVLALLIGLVPVTQAQGPIADAQVVTDYLNMRGAPDAGAGLVERLPNGTLMTANGRNDDGSWLFVTTYSGVTGWVKAAWLALRLDMDVMALPVSQDRIAVPDAPPPVAAPAAQPAQPAAVAAVPSTGATATVVTRVNIRRGPGTSYGRLGTLAITDTITLAGRDTTGTWIYGQTASGYAGWVVGRYTDVTLNVINGLPQLDASAPTASPAPAAPAASSGTGAIPAPVAAPATGGGFMLGGQVSGFTQQGWMQAAGMTWVKRQVVYSNGADPGGVAGLINDAHSRGFRILLSVKGHPNELASDPNYINNLAGYMGGLAALGADAIEVWNEQNIDREWPTGRIDPGWYTQMLAASYNAIKSRNGSTMVISGAPAPTGAEGAFGTAAVWNDDRYVRGMAAAGAANYMDCVGVHYNEGIIPPSQRSGDPRGGHYTRYFWGMVNLYSGAFGGSRPLCFTELGYLTPEGYGTLPGSFGWAQNVTVGQQAAWLAEAARLSRSSGRVRMMIVWNVDFTNWGADPMAGFAIVRPGGDCPACRALAGIW